jgi:hypothetical protein
MYRILRNIVFEGYTLSSAPTHLPVTKWTHPAIRMNTIQPNLSIHSQQRLLARYFLVHEPALNARDILLVYSSVGMASTKPHAEGFGSFDGEGTDHHA